MMRRAEVRPIFGIHPGLILAVLDVIGLAIASYLSVVELGGGVPECGPLRGCETVAQSQYAWIGGVPVAVYGVGLSLVGVIFECYFLFLQVFVIHAVCVWCTAYGLSLVLRFLVALTIWIRRGR